MTVNNWILTVLNYSTFSIWLASIAFPGIARANDPALRDLIPKTIVERIVTNENGRAVLPIDHRDVCSVYLNMGAYYGGGRGDFWESTDRACAQLQAKIKSSWALPSEVEFKPIFQRPCSEGSTQICLDQPRTIVWDLVLVLNQYSVYDLKSAQVHFLGADGKYYAAQAVQHVGGADYQTPDYLDACVWGFAYEGAQHKLGKGHECVLRWPVRGDFRSQLIKRTLWLDGVKMDGSADVLSRIFAHALETFVARTDLDDPRQVRELGDSMSELENRVLFPLLLDAGFEGRVPLSRNNIETLILGNLKAESDRFLELAESAVKTGGGCDSSAYSALRARLRAWDTGSAHYFATISPEHDHFYDFTVADPTFAERAQGVRASLRGQLRQVLAPCERGANPESGVASDL